jgi:glycosyltransferase involved in cell wall biosynthesis
MRVLFVLGGFRIGGYEILSVRLANMLAECGNRIGILSISKESQILDKVNWKVAAYTVAREYKYDISVMRKASRVLKDFNPDVVLSCAYFEYLIARIAAALYSCKAKFILSFHTTEPFDSKERHWNKLYGLMVRFFNDNYIAIHSSQKQYYSTEYGLPGERFTLIHNGVDTDYFRPSERKASQRDGIFRIAHVASLKPLKDQWTLLSAVEELNKKCKKWRLYIAGADQDGILEEYMDFVKRSRLTEKVQFLGAVSDTRDVLIDADVFVLTSLTEALPVSVIEAIAMGLPCIVTDVGGNSDIIENGKQGYLVEPGDYRAIASHLRNLIANPVKRRKMGKAARLTALKQFDFKTMVTKYNQLFCDILSA